jgi:hypothetical protein
MGSKRDCTCERFWFEGYGGDVREATALCRIQLNGL